MAHQIHEPIIRETQPVAIRAPQPAAEVDLLEKAGERSQLFVAHDLDNFRDNWRQVQTSFVDDPRLAVQKADELVASVMKRLNEIFTEERRRLEQTLNDSREPSTEDLRQALQRYRSFFDRLLSV